MFSGWFQYFASLYLKFSSLPITNSHQLGCLFKSQMQIRFTHVSVLRSKFQLQRVDVSEVDRQTDRQTGQVLLQ